ncbi:MAG: electron transfer flavoprotein subunit beta/FixA family protein [Candidatus Accumulibacter sp.]|jgi:electron transfer flavoprotein beta subunit|nr:electron transfer flavoprotein subunit beta/FixA family protein [Accumulibacter sp.]
MKILVAVKRVVDPDARVRVRADGSALDVSGAQRVMNPFDEIALEEAVHLKEKGLATEVIAVSAGEPESQEILRTALARGADRAVLIPTAAALQPLAVAKLLRAVCERESPQLVVCGKQATDDDAAQTGPMLAAMLGWPQAAFASELSIEAQGGGYRATVVREVDEGSETVELPLPAVVTAGLRLNEARFTSLAKLVKARKMPLEILAPEVLGVDLGSRLETLSVIEAPRREPGVRVKSVAELVRILKERGVV